MNLKKFVLKFVRVIVSMRSLTQKILILIDEKSHENMLIDDIQYKILIDSKPLQIRFFKIGETIRIYDELGIQHCLDWKNMKLFTTELDILQPEKYHHIYIFPLFCKNQN